MVQAAQNRRRDYPTVCGEAMTVGEDDEDIEDADADGHRREEVTGDAPKRTNALTINDFRNNDVQPSVPVNHRV